MDFSTRSILNSSGFGGFNPSAIQQPGLARHNMPGQVCFCGSCPPGNKASSAPLFGSSGGDQFSPTGKTPAQAQSPDELEGILKGKLAELRQRFAQFIPQGDEPMSLEQIDNAIAGIRGQINPFMDQTTDELNAGIRRQIGAYQSAVTTARANGEDVSSLENPAYFPLSSEAIATGGQSLIADQQATRQACDQTVNLIAGTANAFRQ